jgi:hypothetical protein
VKCVDCIPEEGALARPIPIRALEGKQPRPPALRRDPRALGGDPAGRHVEQIAHDLPADRRIGVQEPINGGHQRSPALRWVGACHRRWSRYLTPYVRFTTQGERHLRAGSALVPVVRVGDTALSLADAGALQLDTRGTETLEEGMA